MKWPVSVCHLNQLYVCRCADVKEEAHGVVNQDMSAIIPRPSLHGRESERGPFRSRPWRVGHPWSHGQNLQFGERNLQQRLQALGRSMISRAGEIKVFHPASLVCAICKQIKAARWLSSYLRRCSWTSAHFQWRDTFLPAQVWASSQTNCAGNRWAACRWCRWERRWRRSQQERGRCNSLAPPCSLLCVQTTSPRWLQQVSVVPSCDTPPLLLTLLYYPVT